MSIITMAIKNLLFVLTLLAGLSGCSHNDMFSCLDRHCFLADWTNAQSPLSCCHGRNGDPSNCSSCR